MTTSVRQVSLLSGIIRGTFVLFLIVFFTCSIGALAQLSTTATITGTVTDSSGAVVSGAAVTITNDATKVSTKTESNGNGVFVAPGLNVATYSITIAKAGFKNYTVTGIELHPTETVQVNGLLTVGAATETVTVGATSTDVELSSPELSTYISSEQVSSLPMNGRNYQAVAALLPGVINTSQGSALTTGGRSTNSSLSINGMATARSFYAVDGIWNENTGNMTQESVIPNPDSLEEVRVLQNNFSAQYSLLGSSVVLMQTKSGTSNLHGTVWEFVRNDDLNTKNYFSTTAPLISPYKQNIFGFNVGGPVFIPNHYNTNRQKTFFFWDESYVIVHVPVLPGLSQLPTPNQIAGCFTSPIKDPVTGNLFPTVSTCNGQAGTFYQIPAARINTSSEAYLTTLYPAPNYSSTANTNNYYNAQPNTTYQRDDQIKLDHYFTPKYHLLGEYFQEYQKYAQNTVSNGTTPISSETDFTNNKLAAVTLTQTLSPSMVNTTSVAMNIFLLNLTVVGKTDISQIPNFSETLFYPNANFSTRTPVVNLSQLAGQGINGRPIPHASDLDNTVGDNWSWLKGKHYITAGVTFVFNTKRQQSINATNGSFSFTGVSTGQTPAQKTATGTCASGAVATQCTQDDSVADMLLGYIASFSQTSYEPHGDIHDFSWSPYAEDRFQFNKNLTLTLGLRVYHLPLPYGVPNSETNFVPSAFNQAAGIATNVNEFTGATNIPTGTTYSNGMLYNSGAAGGLPVNFSNNHIWYFAPDLGFALDVFGDGKTSLRGGYGMSYTRIFTNQDCSFNCDVNPPVFTNEALTNLVFPNSTPAQLATWNVAGAGGTAAATTSAATITAMDPNIQASPVASWSLGLQHQFPANFVFSIVGAGSRIQHLVNTWNINQPPPTVVGGVSYDFNPLLNSNPANSNKPDSSAYWAPYQGYGNINTVSTQLWGEWNALEVQVKHPVGKGLNVSGSYTWSHDTTNLGSIDPYNLKRFHGNAESMNYPQSLAITAIYQLPFFQHSGNMLEKEALGGWSIDNIATFRSGTSLTPGLGETDQGLALRPDQVPGSSTNGPKIWKTTAGVPQQWFNTSAFSCPGLTNGVNCGTFPAASWGLYGTAQTGIIRGPGQELFNTALYKTFNITEKAHLEFRAEAFNTFNHTNPQNPNTTLSSSNYGKVTGAYDPRFIELAVRLKF